MVGTFFRTFWTFSIGTAIGAFLFCVPQAFAGGAGSPQLPQEQKLANGMTTCVENVSSCTDMPRLTSAWETGMKGASVAVKNFLNMVWGLIKQQPIPTTPMAPAGMPPLPSYPMTSPTGTQPAKTP